MKVLERRWGEVTIKRQGEGKNKFDATKSFSISQTSTDYDLEEYLSILKIATSLTEKTKFDELKSKLERL